MPTVAELFAMAVARHQAGQLPAAEQICRQILDLAVEHADAWHLLGLIASRTGNTAAAIDFFQRAIALKPGFAEAYYNLGWALHELGRLGEAAAAYEQA